jgi:hypothetical protein
VFDCKVCLIQHKVIDEKEARIQDLLSQIEMLRTLAFPKMDTVQASYYRQEADNILSGSDEPIQMTEDLIGDEATRILTGNYDNSQVDTE